MCGFCGVLAFGRHGPPEFQAIERMTDSLAHRGPDGRGVWCAERVALGHQRLSIFDLSNAGAQPMFSHDGRAVTVFNGEIYNWVEVRAELERAGHRFHTRTDTEVLLAAYRAWGLERALAAFRGMFAFALWDLDSETLFLVRDRFGIKPLYYAERDGVLVFGSEIRALLCHPRVSAVLNRPLLAEWLALRFTIAPQTLFSGIDKLEAGHYLSVTRSGIRRVRYWDATFEPGESNPDAAAERYQELFRESVRLRLRADVSLGVFLSGGLDSSAVALEAAAATARPIQTFTVGFRNRPDISELCRARRVADFLGSCHHELELDDVEPEVLRDVVWHLEEPIGDPASVLLYRLAEYTRRHVTVALSGEGSDETNVGYGKVRAFRRWAALGRIPALGRVAAAAWLGRRLGTPLFGSESRVYAELSYPFAARRAAAAGAVDGSWLAGLRRTLGGAPRDPVQRLVYLDLKTWLTDDLMLKVDKATMAFALETRESFLDHKLVEFNLGLPLEWKVDRGGTKRFLRRVLRGRLPDETVAGPQHGFFAPLAEWFSTPWEKLMEEVLGPRGLGRRGLLEPGYVASVRAGVRERNPARLIEGFMLASLETWLDVFGVEVPS